MSSFSSIPILDLSLARNPQTKPSFLEALRYALMEVGFLYLKNAGISDELTQSVISEGKAFFDLPIEEKYAFPISMLYLSELCRAESQIRKLNSAYPIFESYNC